MAQRRQFAERMAHEEAQIEAELLKAKEERLQGIRQAENRVNYRLNFAQRR